MLHVYDKDEEWLLVSSASDEGRIGYVPGNYVEEVRPPFYCSNSRLKYYQTSGEESAAAPAATATALSAIVVPDSVSFLYHSNGILQRGPDLAHGSVVAHPPCRTAWRSLARSML